MKNTMTVTTTITADEAKDLILSLDMLTVSLVSCTHSEITNEFRLLNDKLGKIEDMGTIKCRSVRQLERLNHYIVKANRMANEAIERL